MILDQIDLLVELAMEVDVADPIDWGELNINEEEAFRLMALHVLEMKHDDLTNKAVIVKLMVENFVLNLKLLGKR
jgi:hypothetical protein